MIRGFSLILLLILFSIAFLASCSTNDDHIQNVGMLLESDLCDHPWDKNGYSGFKNIQQRYGVNGYIKENVKTELDVSSAVADLVDKGVNLIFGHSNIYGRYFVEIAHYYPDVHFVYFNGNLSGKNVTSLNFNSHAMGFFAGMVASKMTTTDQIGVIAAYEWQPELEGFYEGVKFQNPKAQVHMNFINDWNEKNVALKMYEEMRNENIDVVYPTGDSFSAEIVREASNDGVYAIGYVEDQSYIDDKTVLTSTIQHIEYLYEFAAEQYNAQTLQSGVLMFDFQEGAISLGEFSPDVPRLYQERIGQFIEKYMETNLLPYEY